VIAADLRNPRLSIVDGGDSVTIILGENTRLLVTSQAEARDLIGALARAVAYLDERAHRQAQQTFRVPA
jgi:hypothetical protein